MNSDIFHLPWQKVINACFHWENQVATRALVKILLIIDGRKVGGASSGCWLWSEFRISTVNQSRFICRLAHLFLLRNQEENKEDCSFTHISSHILYQRTPMLKCSAPSQNVHRFGDLNWVFSKQCRVLCCSREQVSMLSIRKVCGGFTAKVLNLQSYRTFFAAVFRTLRKISCEWQNVKCQMFKTKS